MASTTLIVPGLYSSGPAHWQTWFEAHLPGALRVQQDDWATPTLARWAGRVRQAIDHARGPVWLVAHSFGCLAAVTAAADRPERVAGALLVAPADPERFAPDGLLQASPHPTLETLSSLLPDQALDCPSLLVASRNDPWMKLTSAALWAERWGSRFIEIGRAGHINAESGYGPWPQGLELLAALQQAQNIELLGPVAGPTRRPHSQLARLRHATRRQSH